MERSKSVFFAEFDFHVLHFFNSVCEFSYVSSKRNNYKPLLSFKKLDYDSAGIKTTKKVIKIISKLRKMFLECRRTTDFSLAPLQQINFPLILLFVIHLEKGVHGTQQTCIFSEFDFLIFYFFNSVCEFSCVSSKRNN